MSALVQLEMTLEEAQETDRLIKRHINTTRYLLLDMRDRKGWKALGYESFKEYGEKELGYQENYIHKLVSAAEISLQIGFSQDCTIVQPKESQLRPLAQVPESIRKAIWDEATRKANEDSEKLTAKRVEEAVKDWKRRSDDFRDESNQRRKKIRELEVQIDLLSADSAKKTDEKPAVPADYQDAKDKAARLEADLEKLKAEQQNLVDAQVRAKLRGYQSEVDEMERKKAQIEDVVKRKKAYLDSLDSEIKRIETHQQVINGSRLELIGLAAFLNDLEPMSDEKTIQRWIALAEMHQEAAASILSVFRPLKPRLEVVSHA